MKKYDIKGHIQLNSIRDIQLQLEDIENRISAVRTKVKEEAEENKENLATTKGWLIPENAQIHLLYHSIY